MDVCLRVCLVWLFVPVFESRYIVVDITRADSSCYLYGENSMIRNHNDNYAPDGGKYVIYFSSLFIDHLWRARIHFSSMYIYDII